ncbi:DUF503 domain-containing protein [Candidatus Chlorohelix sp.]|uniref:DUF503 domain-containing protein n=1 Tax=Candidatus Chlorohelix sp. TaxID=3139201 RepID=UPI003059F6BD
MGKDKTSMYIGTCLLSIEIPDGESLKDKRHVVKSIIERAKRELHLSVAEVGGLDEWDYAEIGLAYVSNSAKHADEVIAKAVNWIETNLKDGILGNYKTEIVRMF